MQFGLYVKCDMAADETKPPGFDWLYPGLLSVEQLSDALKARYIKIDALQRCQKEELVELYNKYVIPLPQRKFRLNRRGREMTKKQVVAAKKRRFFTTDSRQDDGQSKEKRRGLITPHGVATSTVERLKPPPSCVNFEKKTIKLGSTNTTQGSIVTSNMKQLTLTNSKLSNNVDSSSCSPTKKVKLNRSLNKESPDDSTVDSVNIVSDGAPRIKLKPVTTTSGNNNAVDKHSKEEESSASPMETDNLEKEEKTKQKKIRKISWP